MHSPKLTHNLCPNCDSDFEILKKLLNDTHLVRGLDYYNKSAFEFVSNKIGSQSAITGGGRYDRLVEFLDGKSVPAVGFAPGIERILDLVKMPQSQGEGIYLGSMVQENIMDKLFAIASQKRQTIKVEIEYEAKSLKANLKNVDKINARYCAVIGENELSQGAIWIKDLETKSYLQRELF